MVHAARTAASTRLSSQAGVIRRAFISWCVSNRILARFSSGVNWEISAVAAHAGFESSIPHLCSPTERRAESVASCALPSPRFEARALQRNRSYITW